MVLFLYLYSREVTNVKFCYREINMNKNTYVWWCQKIREVMADCVLKQACNGSIGGFDKTVEISESCFTRSKYNKGRKFPQQRVFGGIERESKEVFLVKVKKRDRYTLEPLIKKHIKIGTHIISDTYRAYNKIKDIPGYTHSTVNHRKNFVDEEDPNVHIQNMEATWRVAKHRNKVRCGTHRSMLKGYLCEFMYRRLHRNCEDIFHQILNDISEFTPPRNVCEYQEEYHEAMEDGG